MIHDATPAHFCAPSHDFQDIMSPGRRIGKMSSFIWPSQSPDLTLLHFHLKGHLKELVYRDVVTMQTDIVARLHTACTSLDSALLRHAHSSIPRHA
ncbi:uncharacterized protein TNCV_600771 [Trichonephila clavipes]|nr:uncharacterized protein TNCV_600771 [Trichonephila clavipes]